MGDQAEDKVGEQSNARRRRVAYAVPLAANAGGWADSPAAVDDQDDEEWMAYCALRIAQIWWDLGYGPQ